MCREESVMKDNRLVSGLGVTQATGSYRQMHLARVVEARSAGKAIVRI